MTDALTVANLGVSIGEHRLLDDVTLAIAPGTIVCVVGPNGAGKTTLLDAICGIVPAEGTVVVGATGVIGRAFQGSPLPATLTVAECALVVTRTRDQAEHLMDRFGLGPHASTFVSELSTGMRRILDLAVATAHDPALLILDEPSSGLALSEVEHLAGLIRAWRDRSGAGVLVVEHDAALVRAIADEVIVLSEGRLQTHGPATDVLSARRSGRLRLRHPKDPLFADAVATVAAEAVPAAPLPRRTLSTWTVMRLGLRQFAAGVSAVLILGVLNRVMKIELDISLAVVAPILASLNLAAPLALGVGHRSDTKPIFGYRRIPYIIGGSIITAGAVAAAPHLAERLSAGLNAGIVLGALGVFIVMGIGMYGAGTVFFALIADKTPEDERAHVSSIVYLMLLAGIVSGVGLTGGILNSDASNLSTLFAIAAVLVVALTVLAVWGQEERVADRSSLEAGEHVTFRRALSDVWSLPMARRFFWFMIISTIFLFLQQAVLEPYGGEVLGMDVRQTSAFNAMMTFGILLGIWAAGRPWADQVGHLNVARYGLIGSAAAFGLLAWGAAIGSESASWVVLFLVGLGNGLFTVAGLALMMNMASKRYAALFMGAWTVAHALAEGIATASGGVIYEALASWLDSAGAYASIFAIQAAGLALCLPLLARIDLQRFRSESDALDARVD